MSKDNTKKSVNAKTNNGKKRQNVNKNNSSKKVVKKTKTTKAKKNNKDRSSIFKHTKILLVLFALLSLAATYAWFSTNLNVKIRTFNMVVTRTTDLTISFDGINFARNIELNKEAIIDVVDVYPNAKGQWNKLGFVPVSSPGILDHNSPEFAIFQSNGVLYTRKDKEKVNGFLYTERTYEKNANEYNFYVAFDVFIKNESNSPVADNLYIDGTTGIIPDEDIDEEMEGLINSFRIGFVKVGSVGLDATVDQIQNIQCNNDCYSRIYEPNHKEHSALSIERAKKHHVNLKDGFEFPTYAYIKEGGPIYVKESISGTSNIDPEYFQLQETIIEDDLEDTPLFTIPNGITKVRVYVWIEGQDIDSLETNSEGTEVDINIDFVKDLEGYEYFED